MLTKHRIFVGPGFKIAQEVGDAACGGQILITHEAWGQLRQNMAGAGFPTVEQIGLFRLENSPQPTWIYQVGMAALLVEGMRMQQPVQGRCFALLLLSCAASHRSGPPAACCRLTLSHLVVLQPGLHNRCDSCVVTPGMGFIVHGPWSLNAAPACSWQPQAF